MISKMKEDCKLIKNGRKNTKTEKGERKMTDMEYIRKYGYDEYKKLVFVERRQEAYHDVTILKDAERNITVEESFYIGD